ncbi:hypothetical protein HBO12_13770 [Pseudomonas sp. WS 5059]|nr:MULTISPECIES: hypothetical protein [unclassified Pseudomonas]NMX62010.1 hypothetical protein [Pseudomonas sp. WS 5079]NMX66597.1 hypothetical protein [Pseudomonas sp. WS 5111]NMX88143.1 hypothetical protein [Pseudomonas sp. WS 5010]NMY04025.1 hypothetical protein [Pseudomonas sp. WS 5059]
MTKDVSTRPADKKREKTLGIKAFFASERHGRRSTEPTECIKPGTDQP